MEEKLKKTFSLTDYRQPANPDREDCISLINTNSGQNSEITIETPRMINNEITKVTRTLDEIREDLVTQILEVIKSAITEKVLPSIQHVLGVQNLRLITMRDHRSSKLDRSAGDHFSKMDHCFSRLDRSPGDHISQIDH